MEQQLEEVQMAPHNDEAEWYKVIGIKRMRVKAPAMDIKKSYNCFHAPLERSFPYLCKENVSAQIQADGRPLCKHYLPPHPIFQTDNKPWDLLIRYLESTIILNMNITETKSLIKTMYQGDKLPWHSSGVQRWRSRQKRHCMGEHKHVSQSAEATQHYSDCHDH